jgi:hypothetical protein
MINILMAWAMVLCLLVTPAAAENIDSAKRADIEKLIQITGPRNQTNLRFLHSSI